MRTDARQVLEGILSSKLPLIDIGTLTETQRQAYQQQAREILNSPIFINEMNAIIDSCVKEITCRADNYDKVLDMRMTINGLQLLKERLEELAVSPLKQTSTDPYAGV